MEQLKNLIEVVQLYSVDILKSVLHMETHGGQVSFIELSYLESGSQN